MRKTSSKYKSSYSIDLRALEEEVLSEGREWMQRRLEEKLQEKRKSFPPVEETTLRCPQRRKLTVQTLFGDIVLPALYGRDRESGTMMMPLREALGLHGHRPMSPSLEDRLCHLALTA